MRVLTSEDGDLTSKFDESFEKKNIDTALKNIFMDNHTTQANNGKYQVNYI